MHKKETCTIIIFFRDAQNYIVICFVRFIMHLLGFHERIDALYIVLMDFFFTRCIVLIGNKQGGNGLVG